MNPNFKRPELSTKPKSKTDMGTYGFQNQKESFFVSADGEEELKLETLQIFSPKLKSRISSFTGNSSEELSTITTQSPENLSDCEEEEKCCQQIKVQIERMKSDSCKLKEAQPLSNKGEPLSPMLKNQAKMAKIHPFRNLIFNTNCPKELLNKHLKKVHSSLVYGVHHLKKPNDTNFHSKFVCLGEQEDKTKKTLFLDLDETLIHSCGLQDDPKYVIDEDIFKGESAFGFNIRPYCSEFLKIISKYYEVFIFTASSDIYANLIIDVLDPHNKYIKGILFRNHCLQTKKGIFIKDLRIVKNRDLKNMVIVDNNAHAFCLQLENGIPILEWKGDRNDKELKYLLHYLMELAGTDDVRSFNKKVLKLEELSNMDNVEYLRNN